MKTKVIVCGLLLAAFINQANAQDKPKEEFKPSGKLWGLAFGDFYYKQGGDSISNFGDAEYAKTKKDFNGVSLRRVYLGYDYNIAPNFAGHFVLEGSDGETNPSGNRTVFIKQLNLEWKNFLPKHTLSIGQIGTSSFSLAEKTWNYRAVEKTFGDGRKMLASNDMGFKISSQFKLDTAGNNKVGYDLMYGTGKGSKPEDNRLKKFYGGVNASLFKGKILVAANVEYEENEVAKIVGSSHYLKNTTTMEGFIAFQHEKFTLGVEVISQTKTNEVRDTTGLSANGKDKDTLDYTPMGITVFARGTIFKDKLYAFTRYDMYKKNYQTSYKMSSTALYYDEGFLTVGLDYTPNKNVHIIPNVWMNTYTDMRATPTGYDATKSADRAKYYERIPDMVLRLTFYYVFGK